MVIGVEPESPVVLIGAEMKLRLSRSPGLRDVRAVSGAGQPEVARSGSGTGYPGQTTLSSSSQSTARIGTVVESVGANASIGAPATNGFSESSRKPTISWAFVLSGGIPTGLSTGLSGLFIGTYSALRMQRMQGGATRAARTLHLRDGG